MGIFISLFRDLMLELSGITTVRRVSTRAGRPAAPQAWDGPTGEARDRAMEEGGW